MADAATSLAETPRPWLTDGGLETWLFMQRGFAAPEFAAVTLMNDPAATAALDEYFDGFLALAEKAGTGFVLDTATWRAALVWGPRLGYDHAGMVDLNRKAVAHARRIRERWQDRVAAIALNGVVGPLGDGYAPDRLPTRDEALELHLPQIALLAEEGVDMITAVTMTNIPEAVAIALAGKRTGLPVAISFTVETDGRLPSGDALSDAITAVDEATGGYPLYYMINCAHPDHFRNAVSAGEAWTTRIGGLRANASRLSHAELDAAEELDEGDPEEFGALHAELLALLPAVRVLGGCCGTDHRHVACVAHSTVAAEAA